MATTTPIQQRDVILRDGTTLRLRAPLDADREALLQFFHALSPESLYQRFHGSLTVRPAIIEPFLNPDWEDNGTLVAALAAEGGERIVAVANYARLRDPAAAEVAFAVA